MADQTDQKMAQKARKIRLGLIKKQQVVKRKIDFLEISNDTNANDGPPMPEKGGITPNNIPGGGLPDLIMSNSGPGSPTSNQSEEKN